MQGLDFRHPRFVPAKTEKQIPHPIRTNYLRRLAVGERDWVRDDKLGEETNV